MLFNYNMRRNHQIVLILLVIPCLWACSNEQNNEARRNGVQDKTEKSVDEKWAESKVLLKDNILANVEMLGCPGMAFAVVYKGQDFLKMTYGLKNVNVPKDSIDSSTLFRLGSLSKGFAGVLASMLIEEGKFKLDDPVIKYLPDFKLKAKIKGDTIRIRHLLSHSTGLTEHAYSNLIELHKDKETIIQSLSKLKVRDSTGIAYAYQNAAFSLIEEIIEKTTGQSYERVLEAKLFKPLGMTSSSTSYESILRSSNKALPHRFVGGHKGFAPVETDDSYYITPSAGGINSNLEDMSKWLKAVMAYRHDVISSAALNRAFTPYVNSSSDDKYYNFWEGVDSSFYGLGWRIIKMQNRELIFHGGQVNSYRCEIAFDPSSGFGMVAMFNAPCELANTIVPMFFTTVDALSSCANQ